MDPEAPLFPKQGSAAAPEVDALFFYILAVTLFFTALIAVLVMTFAIRYRRRSEAETPQPVKGSLRLEVAWSIVPLVLGLVMFFWGASIFFDMNQPPEDALRVYVVGRQWMWKIQHADGQREINELHVPRGRPIQLLMISEDVIHSFYIPAFRIKKDVLPGRYTSLWFTPTQVDRHHLFCAEYCGTGHSTMIGSIVVMEPSEYNTWLAERAEGSLALEGRKQFLQLQCIACHSGNAQAAAPLLEDLYRRRVPLQDGSTVVADENYLRESILNPNAHVVAGFQPIMPSYVQTFTEEGKVREDRLLPLLVYLQSLRRGQTPPRVEDTPPPIGSKNFSPQTGPTP